MKEDKTKYHDPSEYIRNLQDLLVSDKKKIGFLFGAGTSLVFNPETKESYIPAIGKMTKTISAELSKNDKNKTAIEKIREEIQNNHKTYTIETLLTQLVLKNKLLEMAF